MVRIHTSTSQGTQEPRASVAREVLFERFDVVQELGRGGFGRVVHAVDRETGRHLAVKELRSLGADSLLRFKTEFRALADLRHPNPGSPPSRRACRARSARE